MQLYVLPVYRPACKLTPFREPAPNAYLSTFSCRISQSFPKHRNGHASQDVAKVRYWYDGEQPRAERVNSRAWASSV